MRPTPFDLCHAPDTPSRCARRRCGGPEVFSVHCAICPPLRPTAPPQRAPVAGQTLGRRRPFRGGAAGTEDSCRAGCRALRSGTRTRIVSAAATPSAKIILGSSRKCLRNSRNALLPIDAGRCRSVPAVLPVTYPALTHSPCPSSGRFGQRSDAAGTIGKPTPGHVVEPRGIEPLTSAVRLQRSPI